jgi:signal transduction histidine kinase/ligand-binding sensor domain-containing protein
MKTGLFLARWFVAAVALLGPSFVRASEVDNLLSGYSLTSWNDADGRSLGAVYAIAQHQDGYLWLGTDTGLYRFDGSRFVAWDDLGDSSLPPAAVTAVSAGRDGSLWVGFADGAGVWRIRNGRASNVSLQVAPTGSVTDLVEDSKGVIWAVADGVLYAAADNHFRPVDIPWPGPSGRVLQAAISREGELWIATRWGVFRHLNSSNKFLIQAKGFIWGLSQDRSGTFWTTDITAGFRQLGAPGPPREAPQGAGHRLLHDRRGNLWVATFSEGLWRVAPEAQNVGSPYQRADLRTGLASDSIQSLLEDSDGNIWVGTTGGLHRLTPHLLTPVNNIGFVVTIAPSDKGRVWVCRTNGIVELSTNPSGWTDARTGSAGPDIRSLYRDPHGTLWIGATEGLFRWESKHLVLVTPATPPLSAAEIVPDANGTIWVNDSIWLYKWESHALRPLERPASLAHARVTFTSSDSSGRLWVGFSGGKIGSVDPTGAIHLVDLPDNPTRIFYTAFEDDAQTVWFGSSEGIGRLLDGKAQLISVGQGLPEKRVWAITEDSAHRLWLTTDRGLVVVDESELQRAFDNSAYRVRYRFFDTSDGLAGASIGVIRSARATDGALWFVRGGGLTIVDPHELDAVRPRTSPSIKIDTVVANDRRIGAVPSAPFPPGTRRLQINYTALNLNPRGNLRFRYRLDGVDTNWVDAGVRRGAFYTNLGPGRYQFRVEGLSTDGSWNAANASWAFSIEPAFYQTPWFYAFCSALAALGLWALWRFRMELVRRQFAAVLAERVRLSREIHDTLLQSLVGVMLQFDVIAKALGAEPSPVRDQIMRIRRQVEAHIREARESIRILRSPRLELRGLSKGLVRFATAATSEAGVQFESNVIGTPADLPPELESNLLRIGQEAVTNAVRHAHASHVRLELRFDQDSITLRVADDGCGFDAGAAAQSNSHYGITTMRERATQIGAGFRIVSSAGEGSLIEVIAPHQ